MVARALVGEALEGVWLVLLRGDDDVEGGWKRNRYPPQIGQLLRKRFDDLKSGFDTWHC